jgi:hypothetical protein
MRRTMMITISRQHPILSGLLYLILKHIVDDEAPPPPLQASPSL